MVETNVKKIYDAVSAEAVLTSQADYRQYLTGFSSSFGYVISDKEGSTFYTDPRYLEAAKSLLAGSDIKVSGMERGATVYDLISKYKQVAIPVSRTYAPVYNKIKEMGIEIVDSNSYFEKAMSVKSAQEIQNIQDACEITDKAFVTLLSKIKEGMTEIEVAAELEYLMRKFGSSGVSFDTIVAFGANSSVPHHETGNTKLQYGDNILIDFGCKVNGYCSDCTRTVLFGDDGKHDKFKKDYDIVLTSHMLVKEKLVAGMTGKQADAIARDYLKANGLAEYFTHSLGHGIGINIHEYPRLSHLSDDLLVNGMVFSDEPGVYFEGEYGIRIEDTVTLSEGKVISMTDSDKKLIIL